MKYILLIILSGFSLYDASAQQYTAVKFEKRFGYSIEDMLLSSSGAIHNTRESLNVKCTNVFEWLISFASTGKTFNVNVNGLANDESEEFLYDSEQLFYKPQQKNNVLDFSCNKRWEVRFSLVINLYFKK